MYNKNKTTFTTVTDNRSKSYINEILTEDGRRAEVIFKITENSGAEDQSFGISSVMYVDGVPVESERAEERFFTEAETEKVIEMLCKYDVTPCTLRQII